MNAEKRLYKMIGTETFEEVEMTRGHTGQNLLRRQARRSYPVTCQRGVAAVQQKHLAIIAGQAQVRKKHVFVVSLEKNHFAGVLLAPIDQIRNDPFGIGPAVDVIAEEDKPVLGFQRQSLEQIGQLLKAAMDISDNKTLHNGLILSYSVSECKAR